MLKGSFSEENLFIKLILTVFAVIAGFLASVVIAYFVIYLLYDVHQLSDISLILQQNTSVLKVFSFFQSIGLFILPTFVMAYFLSQNSLEFLLLKKNPKSDITILVLISVIAVVPFINWLSAQNAAIQFPAFLKGVEQWMKSSENAAAILTERFLDVKTIGGLLTNILVMAIIPAIAEEFFFRGLLQNYFGIWTKNVHAAIWITAFIFSAIHFQFYGFIPRMLIGAYFGYLLVWSGSIWLPMLAHFANNALAVVFVYLNKSGATSIDADKIGTESTLYVSMLSLLLFVSLVFVIKRRSKA